MNKPLILSLQQWPAKAVSNLPLIHSGLWILSFYSLTYQTPFVNKLLMVLAIIFLILIYCSYEYIDTTYLILNKEYLLSPNGFPFFNYYKTVRINWADVQKITLTTPFFTFLTKSEKHILSNIKLTLYTTQGKFSLHPIDWKTIDITANKKKGIFDYDSVSYKDGSYASATELEAYIYALPLMQFLTEQNMIIQQDQDLLKTIYFGDLIFNLISKVVIVGIIGFLLYQLISDFNG